MDATPLPALSISCSLRCSPDPSRIEGLIDESAAVMETAGISVMKRRVERFDGSSHLGKDPEQFACYSQFGGCPINGTEDDLTARNATLSTWNLIHRYRMLKSAGRIPAHGNQPAAWDETDCFVGENLEHRRR